MSKITWLHLSDFHFRTEKSPNTSKVEDFNRNIVLESLLADIRKYPADHGLKIDFAIITGDIAFSGQEHEYHEAEKFLEELRGVLKLKKDRLFVVPGNHDIDRSKIKRTLKLDVDSKDGINEFLMDAELKALVFKKFQGYKDFVDRYFDGKLIFDYESNYFWTKAFSIRGMNVAILGLNSAWNSCGDKDDRQLLIGEKQVADALKQTEKPKPNLTIAAFHHPFDWLKDSDRSVVERDLREKCQFILHGHLHVPGYGLIINPDCQVAIIPAGACYDKRPYRNSYNYVTFDPSAKTGQLHLRAYSDNLKAWVADNDTFKNAKEGICGIDFNVPAPRKRGKSAISMEIPAKYREWLITQCESIDISKLVESRDSGLIGLKLPQIFVPLYANPLTDRKRFREGSRDAEEEQKSVDIEELVASNDYLVVRGQAGSGKTTLMKHMAYSIVQQRNEHGLNEYLPLLIFLRDVPGVIPPREQLVPGARTAEKILGRYFRHKCDGLDNELIKAFCREGKAIFLVDGLDEIEPELRKLVIHSLADFRSEFKSTASKMILSGRSHGVDVVVSGKFPDKCVDINSLNSDQMKTFIGKWFEWDKELKLRGKTPEDMFAELRDHPSVEELMSTPLMLTAACILYHYDKKLPEQRAELYEKIINNLICKRFPNSKQVQDLLMKIARVTHEQRKKAFSGKSVLDLMAGEWPKKGNETQRQRDTRVGEEFDHIEQNCGLLKVDKGEYSFWHLSFQAFLAARDVVVHEQVYAKATEKYWDDDWFSEALRLFIGHLSNSSQAVANGILEAELKRDEQSPFRHWRQAAKALLDIHPGSRDKGAVERARSRLLELINNREEEPRVLADAGETLGWLGDTRDLKEFVGIEGGKYKLKGLGTVSLQAFGIGKYPVTNQWYEEFIKAGGYEKKNEQLWTPQGWKWLCEAKYECPEYWHDRAWKCPNAPVVGVSWYEADAFCRWLSITRCDGYTYRLPTEQEWQACAAGKDGREYPWGPWLKNRCNTDESGIGKTSAVGIFANGKTPEGVADLAGNVWEWTCSDYDIKKQRSDFTAGEVGQVLRGGSWNYARVDARCSTRYWYYPSTRYYFLGFRCAGIK